MRLGLLALVALLTGYSVAQAEIPPNASLSPLGNAWVCNFGFSRQNDACVAVRPPVNATVSPLGNDWICNFGFVRQGDTCLAVRPPENAKVSPLGNNWVCNFGFARQGDVCLAVRPPENAKVSPLGNNWVCNFGFARQGDVCLAVRPPENAKVSPLGNNWVCDFGFARQGDACAVVRPPENASITPRGNNWVCNNGFVRKGDSCVALGQTQSPTSFRTSGASTKKLEPEVMVTTAVTKKLTPDPIVEAIQNELNRLGYEVGPADGLLGPKSIRAIKQFEASKRRTVTGKATPGLWAILVEETGQARTQTVQKPRAENGSTNSPPPMTSTPPIPAPQFAQPLPRATQTSPPQTAGGTPLVGILIMVGLVYFLFNRSSIVPPQASDTSANRPGGWTNRATGAGENTIGVADAITGTSLRGQVFKCSNCNAHYSDSSFQYLREQNHSRCSVCNSMNLKAA
jgi:peptidoglycan hydrolase-like protein with peptidoglycan-binding domain